MALQVTYTYLPKDGGKYDFNNPQKTTEMLGESAVPSKRECESLLNKLMARRDVLVSEVHDACIVVGTLEISQAEDGEWTVSDYPDVAGIAPAASAPSTAPATTDVSAGAPVPTAPRKKDALDDEIRALMRGKSYRKTTNRQIYYDPPESYLVQLSHKQDLTQNGTYDASRSLFINKKIYTVYAEADNPRGSGLLCIVRNEDGKLVTIQEHFVVDHSRDGLTNSITPDKGPQLDFGRTVPDTPGDVDLRRGGRGGGAPAPVRVVDPNALMQQIGVAPNREIPGSR